MHRLGAVSRPLLQAVQGASTDDQRVLARRAAVDGLEQAPEPVPAALTTVTRRWRSGEDATAAEISAATTEAERLDEEYLEAWEAVPAGQTAPDETQRAYLRARAGLAVAYAAEDTPAGFLDALTESASGADGGATVRRLVAERLGLDPADL